MQKQVLYRLLITALAGVLLTLSGCAPLVVAGATTTGVMVNDSRTSGSFIEDEALENKTLLAVLDEFGTQVHVVVVSYNRKILLLGQVPNTTIESRVVEIAESQEKVEQVYNRLEIAAPSSLTTRLADTAVTGKVKARLCALQVKNFSCLDVKVVTEAGVVYLLGLVTEEMANIAVENIRQVGGVKRVVKVFEYL